MDLVTIGEVQALLADKRRWMRFPESIEKEFARQTHSFRSKVIRAAIIPTLLIYNAFLLADYILVPSTFALSAVLHFCVVSPAIIAAGLFYDRIAAPAFRDAVVASIPLLVACQIMTIHILSPESGSGHYQYLAVMVLVYMNVNLRNGFRNTLIATAIFMTIYLGALLAGPSTLAAKFVGTSSIFAAAYLTLQANFRMDKDMRYTFLRRLHDRLLRESAESRAHRDALTGIANRHLLENVAEEIWLSNDDSRSPIAVVMIDIDHFKAFNDRLGHPAGDECLKRVAYGLSCAIGQGELIVRYGGEEFVALLPATDLPDAVRRAEHMRHAIAKIAIPHPGIGIGGIVTASFGVMSGPVSRHTLAELIAGADAALYAAKRSGRNVVWPPVSKVSEGVVPLFPSYKTGA